MIYTATQKAEDIKAVESMENCGFKRKRQIDEIDENKEKCLLLENPNVSYLIIPFIIIIV